MKPGADTNLFNSLRFRIMLPAVIFTLIFSAFFLAINNYYTSRILDLRLEKEAIRISRITYESRFILNPSYLKRLGKIIEGKIAVFDSNSRIISATFVEAETNHFLSLVNPVAARNSHIENKAEQVVKKITASGTSFLLVTRILSFHDAKDSILLAILTPLSDLESIKSKILFRTLLSGFIALFIAFLTAGFILKKLTATFKKILTVTGKIASGDFAHKIKTVEIKELDALTLSINQMSEKLVAYEKKLIDTAHLKSADKITSAMAHEIKNPLSSMKLLAQMIEKQLKEKDEDAQLATAMIKEINRVDTLVSDLRSLSGQKKFLFSTIDPKQPLEEVLAIISPKLNHLNIGLTVQTQADMVSISMDKDKIKQVLWNLIMNGAESMPDGGDLNINLCTDVSGEFIQYRITDQGSGIDSGLKEKIFAPFFTTKKEGLGIGLFISKEIAAAHHGKITIESTRNGTRAALVIPMEKGIDIS